MKIRAFIPVFIALFVLVVAPFSSTLLCGSKAHGGLVAYCCLDAGKPCSTICCGECKTKAGLDVPRGMVEMMIPLRIEIVHPPFTYVESCRFPKPNTIYPEVPQKPPNCQAIILS